IAGGAPALRRRFVDIALSQVSPLYLGHLQSYSEALRQRNAAFRTADISLLEAWNEPLVSHGVEVALTRSKAVTELADLARDIHAAIAPDDPPLEMNYRSALAIEPDDSRERASERFRRALAQSAQDERARQLTLVGPHRDEIVLKMSGREVRSYGSQGQQRTVALALRLAEMRWMARQSGETPVLLVDDLGAELDSDRRHRLLALFGSTALAELSAADQTLATTASDRETVARMIGATRTIEVREGRLNEER
ncbi:DNA replication and repair protein RecF, partial [Candidatus Sumerlaeota bacterium]|nr:DNA replication and repair protein RecF [Candidatus Sumerlaeota bacterium]